MHVMAQLANLSYGGTDAIMGKALAKQSRAYVSVPGDTQVKYFLGFNDARKVQVVGVRGTVNEVNWSASRPARRLRSGHGAILHAGFERAADALYADLKPRRSRVSAPTPLVGHSLGGAVAAILGTTPSAPRLPVERACHLRPAALHRCARRSGIRCAAPGPGRQPERYRAAAPRYHRRQHRGVVQFGTAVVVFPGPYYALVPAGAQGWAAEGAFRRDLLLQASLPDHAMRFYEENLRGKDRRAERVSGSPTASATSCVAGRTAFRPERPALPAPAA